MKAVRTLARGSLAVSASRDHTLRLWDLLSGREKFMVADRGAQEPPEPRAWSLHVDEAGKVLYSVSSCKVRPAASAGGRGLSVPGGGPGGDSCTAAGSRGLSSVGRP